jgi:hypothetical protein
VTRFRESPHNYHRIGSSGSNLACEGLLLGMQAEGHGDRPEQELHPRSEPSLHNNICAISSHFFAGEVSYTAGLQPGQGRGKAGSDGELSVQRMALKVISTEEASRRRQISPRVISTSEVSDFSVIAQGTHVMFSLVGHRNICKSQRTVMTP